MPAALPDLLDRLASAGGPPGPIPAEDGWELVLRENVAYLVDDATRDRCMAALQDSVGLEPAAILAASDQQLAAVVAGPRPVDRIERLRSCAELHVSRAPWRAYPGIGRPGVERIELFTGARAVLALDSNGLRVLYRLGYGELSRTYDSAYRTAQRAAAAELPADIAVLRQAHQLLRRHGQTICTRAAPGCPGCPLHDQCAAALGRRSMAEPYLTGRRP
jgi:hypothetical protein